MNDKWSDIEYMKEMLTSCMKSAIDRGIEKIDTKEAGEIVDMIKDLAMTEKYCWEKKYYEAVVEAMEEGNEPAYGYNTSRYSNGRYAPKGSGHMGYRPYMDQEPYINGYLNDPDFKNKMRMGYIDEQYRDNGDGRYGKAYNEYRMAKKHYTETNSMTDKEEMNMHANEHVNDMITTVRDIWKGADPDLKKKMKNDIQNLMSEMTI